MHCGFYWSFRTTLMAVEASRKDEENADVALSPVVVKSVPIARSYIVAGNI